MLTRPRPDRLWWAARGSGAHAGGLLDSKPAAPSAIHLTAITDVKTRPHRRLRLGRLPGGGCTRRGRRENSSQRFKHPRLEARRGGGRRLWIYVGPCAGRPPSSRSTGPFRRPVWRNAIRPPSRHLRQPDARRAAPLTARGHLAFTTSALRWRVARAIVTVTRLPGPSTALLVETRGEWRRQPCGKGMTFALRTSRTFPLELGDSPGGRLRGAGSTQFPGWAVAARAERSHLPSQQESHRSFRVFPLSLHKAASTSCWPVTHPHLVAYHRT